LEVFNLKLTSSQTLILHLLESVLVSALLAGIVAGYQYLGSDTVNTSALVGVFVAAFLASFFKGFLGLQNNAQLVPAIQDTLNEVKDLVAQPGQPTPPIVNIDTSTLATQLSNELMKIAASQQAQVRTSAHPIEVSGQDTVKTVTPPPGASVPNWMNQSPPNRAG
jgi:hypothetical protein